MHLREVQLLLTELACDRQDYASPSVWTTANSIAHHPAQNGTSADNIFRLDTCTPVKHTPAFITLKKGGIRWHEPKRPCTYGISSRSGQKTSVAHLINEAGHTFLSGFYRSLPINIPGWRDTS